MTLARPEPPSPYQYNEPSAPSSSYGAPARAASVSSSYGAPQPAYGAPSQPPVIHKHVYVHVSPPEPEYPAARYISPLIVSLCVSNPWICIYFLAYQSSDFISARTETLQDRFHQGAVSTGRYGSSHSIAATKWREDTGLCACEAPRWTTRYYCPNRIANAAQQARGLFYTIQDPGLFVVSSWFYSIYFKWNWKYLFLEARSSRSISRKHSTGAIWWIRDTSFSTFGTQQFIWRSPLRHLHAN